MGAAVRTYVQLSYGSIGQTDENVKDWGEYFVSGVVNRDGNRSESDE